MAFYISTFNTLPTKQTPNSISTLTRGIGCPRKVRPIILSLRSGRRRLSMSASASG